MDNDPDARRIHQAVLPVQSPHPVVGDHILVGPRGRFHASGSGRGTGGRARSNRTAGPGDLVSPRIHRSRPQVGRPARRTPCPDHAAGDRRRSCRDTRTRVMDLARRNDLGDGGHADVSRGPGSPLGMHLLRLAFSAWLSQARSCWSSYSTRCCGPVRCGGEKNRGSGSSGVRVASQHRTVAWQAGVPGNRSPGNTDQSHQFQACRVQREIACLPADQPVRGFFSGSDSQIVAAARGRPSTAIA